MGKVIAFANQKGGVIVSFLIAVFLCGFMYTGFEFIYDLSIFGGFGLLVSQLGINAHYTGMSRGVIDTRDVLYFLSLIDRLVSSERDAEPAERGILEAGRGRAVAIAALLPCRRDGAAAETSRRHSHGPRRLEMDQPRLGDDRRRDDRRMDLVQRAPLHPVVRQRERSARDGQAAIGCNGVWFARAAGKSDGDWSGWCR